MSKHIVSRVAWIPATIVSAGLVGIGLTGMASAQTKSATSPFIRVTSHQSFAATIAALKRAVASKGMMVLGSMNQGGALSITGMKLQGQSFFIGNPVVGKQIFTANRGAGGEIPARVYVWVNVHGKTQLGYFLPSVLLGEISPSLAPMGTKLNLALHAMVAQAAR